MTLELTNLKESNEFLNVLFDNITSAIFIVDESIRVNNFNDSFSILFEKKEEQIMGKLCGNAIGCSFAVEANADCGTTPYCKTCTLRKNIIKTMSHKIPIYKKSLSREFYGIKNKNTKHFIYTTKYIQYHDKNYILIIVDDHTELEERKKRLEDQNKTLQILSEQKSKFLGIAAHDLRNPIGAISSFSEILLESENEFPKEEKKELLTLIKDSSNFSLHLLNDLLDISKIELGKLELEKNIENIEDTTKHVIKINKVFARKKNITFKFESKLKTKLLSFDRSKIEQVLHNLISNAIKYSNPHTNISISIIENSPDISISIKDQGVGIPKDELSKLFTEFGKTSAKTTANESSTGLGLAIAKKIIIGHEGKIIARSKLGEGSEFLFTLPK